MKKRGYFDDLPQLPCADELQAFATTPSKKCTSCHIEPPKGESLWERTITGMRFDPFLGCNWPATITERRCKACREKEK